MKRACLIVCGHFIQTAELADDAVLPADWYQVDPPAVPAGKHAVTLDNGATWHFTADRGYGTPAYRAPAPLTHGKFRDRFTFAERIAIDGAPENTDLPAATRAAMRTLNKDFEAASQIELDHAHTIVGLQMIESFGLLAAGRAEEILAW